MDKFLATQIILGKLTWATLKASEKYSSYADSVVAVLDSRGYKIDDEGNCVVK